MYDGYLSLGGTELINAARTEAYLRHNAATIPFRNCAECDALQQALDEGPYESPIVDDAPWFDPNNPSTGRFFGLYPLSIEGVEDSTRSAEVTQSILEGGTVGSVRHGTRSIRVRGILLAADEMAMSAGTTWLRNALDPSPCTAHGGSCGGAQLCYYASCPIVCDMYEPSYIAGPVFTLLNETVAASPLIFRNILFGSSMWKAKLEPSPGSREGVIVRWGAGPGGVIPDHEVRGPIVFRRINYVVNSTFATGNLTGWSSSGGGTVEVVDDSYVYGDAPYGTGPYGGLSIDDPYLRRTGGAVDGSSTVLTRTDDMVAYSGQVTASFELWHDDADAKPYVMARLRATSDNTILDSAQFDITTGRVRYDFTSPIGGSCYLEFVTGGSVNIDNIMLEAGETPLPYFNGDTPYETAMAGYITGEIENEYTVSWLDLPNTSASMVEWNGTVTIGAASDGFDESVDGACDALPVIHVSQLTLSGTLTTYIRPAIPVAQQVEGFERTFHDVTCVEGPLIINEHKFSDGSVMREVDFLLVAGRPASYGPTKTVLGPVRMIDLSTQTWLDVDCSVPEPTPIIDPDCPPIPAPPRPPSITNACVTEETQWQRYWLNIPAENISAWASTSPQVTITSGVNPIRQVRVRAYPNPFARDTSLLLDYRQNRAWNPAAVDAATGTGWYTVTIGTTGTSSLASVTRPDGLAGSAFRNTVSSGTTSSDRGNQIRHGAGATAVIPAVANEVISVSMYAMASVSRQLAITYMFRDSAGSIIGSQTYGPNVSATANEWVRLSAANITVPNDPNIAGVIVGVTGGGGVAWNSGEWLQGTMVLVEALATISGYFDGSSVLGDGFYYGWQGVANSSASIGITSPIDPCSYCSEFVVSYLPANTELTVDSILERAFASVSGADAISANHLLYAADGSPMVWPELTCGQGYLFAIDVPEPLLDDVTVTMTLTNKE